MARYEPSDLMGDLAPINAELEKIKEAIIDTVSRKGDAPNAMTANLDMNSNRILNLPDAVNDAEPVTFRQAKLIAGGLIEPDLSQEQIDLIVDSVTENVLEDTLLTDMLADIDALELEDLNLRTDVNGIITDLNSEIVRINNIFGELDTIDTAIINETTQRTSADEALSTSVTGLAAQYDGLSAQLLTEQTTRASADEALVQAIQTLQTFSAKIFVQDNAPTIGVAPDNASVGDLWYDSNDNNHPYTLLDIGGTPTWTSIRDGQFTVLQSQVQNEQTARITSDEALAQDITDLTSTVVTNQSLALAAVQSEATARSTADSSLAQDITNLTSTVNTNNTNVLSALTAEQTARTNADSALASDITTLAATVNTNNTNALAAIQNEATVRADADTAISSTVSTLTSTVNNNTASIQTTQTVTNGLAAQYMVKTDVNGYVSGYGLYNTGATSDFIVLADRFAVVTPGIAPSVPFEVVGGNVFIKNAAIGTLSGKTITGSTFITTAVGEDSVEVKSGTPFGVSGNLFEWYGLKVNGVTWDNVNNVPIPSGMSTVNSKFHKTVDGRIYFGGSFQAGTLSNSTTNTQLATTSIADLGSFGSNGGQILVTGSFSYAASTFGSGSCPTGTATTGTLFLERYVSGSWNIVAQVPITGTYNCSEESGEYISEWNSGGSVTFTDNNQNTTPRQYRARAVVNALPGTQRNKFLSCVSTEE